MGRAGYELERQAVAYGVAQGMFVDHANEVIMGTVAAEEADADGFSVY